MPEIITLGETMAVMVPKEAGPLRYVHGFHLRMAGAESNTAIVIKPSPPICISVIITILPNRLQ